jgi:hypothetical protein
LVGVIFCPKEISGSQTKKRYNSFFIMRGIKCIYLLM